MEVWLQGPTSVFKQHRAEGKEYLGRKKIDMTGQDNWSQDETAFNTTSKIMESFEAGK